jgi:sarcosine oxidase subunit alpha
MMSAAVRAYANRFAVAAGRAVAVFTNNNDGWRTARDLQAHGMVVAAVVDARTDVPGHLSAGIDARIITGASVAGTKGAGALRAVTIHSRGGHADITCDALAVSGGWNSNVALACHLGGAPVWNETASTFVPGQPPKGMKVVGAAGGTMTLGRCLAEGTQAGWDAAAALDYKPSREKLPNADDEPFAVKPVWHVAASRQKAFVDFQNDVTAKDVELAERGVIGRPIRPSRSGHWPDITAAGHSGRSAGRLHISGQRRKVRSSWKPEPGCAHNIFPGRARRTGLKRSSAKYARCAKASVSATSPR